MITNLLSFGDNILTVGGNALSRSVDPLNPLSLPPYTIRLKFTNGVTPTFSKGTGVQVSSSPNVWDLTHENTDWNALMLNQTSLLEVLGANSTGVSRFYRIFEGCTSLESIVLFDTSSVETMASAFFNCRSLTAIPLFDTSNVTIMTSMLAGCRSLTSVPVFNTSNVTNMQDAFSDMRLTTLPLLDTRKVTDMDMMVASSINLTELPLFDMSSVTSAYKMCESCTSLKTIPYFDTSSLNHADLMFSRCYNVESGALALYNRMKASVSNHNLTFQYCGRDTVTGAAELAQIPASWGGTAS